MLVYFSIDCMINESKHSDAPNFNAKFNTIIFYFFIYMYRHNLFELAPWFVYVKIQVKSLYKMTPVFVLCTKWPDTLYDSSYQCQLPYLHQLFTYNSLLTPCYYETCISYTFQFVTLKIPQMCTWVIFQDIGNGRHSLNICGVYNTAKVM